MTPETTKEKMLHAVQELPRDVTFEEAMERLYFLYKVERGLTQVDEGQTVSHEEAKRQREQWRA